MRSAPLPFPFLVACLGSLLAGCNGGASGPAGGGGPPAQPDAPRAIGAGRTLAVAADGSAAYRTIGAAIADAQAGDTIVVGDGVYAETPVFTRPGRRGSPIALIAAAGAHPVIEPGGVYEQAVTLRAEWILVQGFEIRGGWDDVLLYAGHATIRGNHIHDAVEQGVLVVSVSDVLIEDNVIEHDGVGTPPAWLNHGIYLSDFYHRGMTRIAIARNVVRDHAGAGVHAYSGGGGGGVSGIVIEDNVLMGNTHEIAGSGTLTSSLIRNNTFVHLTHPPTGTADNTFGASSSVLWLEAAPGNRFVNNLVDIAPTGSVADYAIIVRDASDAESFDGNCWSVAAGMPWLWRGTTYGDFAAQYRAITGQDAHGPGVVPDPGLVDAATGDVHLRPGSPAIDAAIDAEAPAVDIEGTPRPQGAHADIGAVEAVPSAPG